MTELEISELAPTGSLFDDSEASDVRNGCEKTPISGGKVQAHEMDRVDSSRTTIGLWDAAEDLFSGLLIPGAFAGRFHYGR